MANSMSQTLAAMAGWIAALETWTYASSDTAAGGSTSTNGVSTYTFTITGDLTSKYSAGMKIKLTQTSDKYFIITKVEHSAGTTTVTIFGGTDYTLANAAITLPYYSMVSSPQGFPLNPEKWTVEFVSSSNQSQSTPTASTWYNIGSQQIAVPIGSWDVGYHASIYLSKTASTSINGEITLSTANNSELDAKWTVQIYSEGASGSPIGIVGTGHREYGVSVTTKTPYYLNRMVATASAASIFTQGHLSPTIIYARCAYL